MNTNNHEYQTKVNTDKCKLCGLCVKECGRHLPLGHKGCVDFSDPHCNRCLHCYAVCPYAAIEVEQTAFAVTSSPLANTMASLRSHRKYEARPLDADVLRRLLDVAAFIPSGGARQAHSFTIITSNEVKDLLRKEMVRLYANKLRLMRNPFLRTLVAPFVDRTTRGFLLDPGYRARFADLVERFTKGDDPVFHGAPVVILIHSDEEIPTPKEDCVLAGHNLTMAAQAEGLGSCFVSMAQKAMETSKACRSLAKLPKRATVHAVVVLGHPAQTYLRNIPKSYRPEVWL